MTTADLLTEAAALWATSRKGYRDGLVGVGRLLQRYVVARVTAGDGMNEQGRRAAGASRMRATADAAAALGSGAVKVRELLRVAAVADLLAPTGGFGALSYSCLRLMRVFVHRPGRGKRVSRVKGGSDGHLPASALENWAVRPGFAKTAPDLVARAVAGAWRESDLRRELARKGAQVEKSATESAGGGCQRAGAVLFTTGGVARLCRVAPRTVSNWVDSGRLKGYRIPGSRDRRVPLADLLTFLRRYGMPVPPEIEPASGAQLAFGIDAPPGFRTVDVFGLGAAVASGAVAVALIGDADGLSLAVRAARFVRAGHGAARLILAVAEDAGGIDPAGMAGVEIHRGPINWFGLGLVVPVLDHLSGAVA